jgi:hypothetical protein
MMLSTSFKCSPMRVPLRRCNSLGYSSAAQRAAGVSRLVPHALLRLLQPEDRLALGEGDPHPLPDRVRLFRERENVGQEGFDALVHRVSLASRIALGDSASGFCCQQHEEEAQPVKRTSGVR